ncbi:MAG: endonuclease/exonuclease/phosphatase family protein [Bacteroidales bacterium]|nr:endonuclease/exonuclease/phosphatase family protein [Candidatus Cryptobacteroides aphodequi]
MKRLLYSFLAAALILSAATPAQAQKRSYIIGFYNLENLFDTYNDPAHNDEEFLPEGKNKWTPAKYQKKVHNMAEVIRAMHDDNKAWHTILGISEIENRMVVEDLVADPQIAEANYQIVHYDGPDRRGVDVGLLYDPSKFKLLDSESIPFTFEDTKVKITLDQEAQDYFRTRDILMVHGLIDGEHFAFYVCHLPSRLGGKGADLRSRGAEIIYNHSRKMEQKYPGIKIAVMGDMNDNPTDDSQALWLHGRETIGEMAPEDFFDPFTSMLKDGYGSLAYRGEWNIYDIVQVNYNMAAAPNGGLKIQPIVKEKYYGRIFKKPFMTQQSGQYKGTPFRTFSNGAFIGGYSDHYPTYIVISK